jgi:hypothetical protein
MLTPLAIGSCSGSSAFPGQALVVRIVTFIEYGFMPPARPTVYGHGVAHPKFAPALAPLPLQHARVPPASVLDPDLVLIRHVPDRGNLELLTAAVRETLIGAPRGRIMTRKVVETGGPAANPVPDVGHRLWKRRTGTSAVDIKGPPRTRQSSLTLAAFRPWGSSARCRHAGGCGRV